MTMAQFATGRSCHFLYSSCVRKYMALKTASSFGNEPRFVTFRKLEFTLSMALVVYITFLTVLP